MDKHTAIKKEIYENMKENGFELKMDKETSKAIEEERLKKYMNSIMKAHMGSVKANLSGKKEKVLKASNTDNIEIEKKQFEGNDSQVYGKEFMVNKIKEVYG